MTLTRNCIEGDVLPEKSAARGALLGYKLANAPWRDAEAAIAADRKYSRGPGDAGRLLESRLRLLWRRRCKHAMRCSRPGADWCRTVTQVNTADRLSCSSIIPSMPLPRFSLNWP
jgi:transposase InsO family protein